MTIKPFNSNLEFTTNGELSLFFIGTGNAFEKDVFQTNLFIAKGKDHLLIDCGTLCSYVMEKWCNTDIKDIENVLFTHPHADHIGGAEEMALVGKYIARRKINLVITDKLKKLLWNESLRGGIQYSEEGKMTLDDYFNQLPIKQIQKKPFEMHEANVGSINLKLFRTRHVTTHKNSLRDSMLSYGVIIDDRILFTADTQFNEPQLKFLLEKYNIETIFHDCDISGYSRGVHASYEELCSFPAEIRKKMYLCHYTKVIENIDTVKAGFAGLAKPRQYYIF